MLSQDLQIHCEKMEEIRRKMVQTAMILGLSHPTVLRYSQQLDDLYTITMLNQYASK